MTPAPRRRANKIASLSRELLAYSRNPFLIFVSTVFAVIIYIFYSSPLRLHVEEYFYDIRTIVKPDRGPFDDIVVVKVDEGSLLRLAGSAQKDLSIEHLLQLLHVFTKAEARVYALLLMANVFDYTDPRLDEVTALVKADPRFLWGSLNLNSKGASLQEVPSVLQSIVAQLGGIDSVKKRSNSLIRRLPFTSYRGLHQVPMLPTMVAERLDPDFAYPMGHSYLLNFWQPSAFPSIDAADLLQAPERYREALRGKTVVFGYTIFRPWSYATTDQMNANTPLKNTPNSYLGGESMTYVTTNAIENLLHRHWLKDSPAAVHILQTILIALLFGWVWRYGTVVAPLIVIAAWLCLIYLHGLAFSYLSIFIPLADTALFSSMALILGAIRRSKYELQRYAGELARTETQQELASLQARYLSNFAGTLSLYNSDTIKELTAYQHQLHTADPKQQTILQSALASCEEFDEYLAGIRQLSRVDAGDQAPPERHPVALRPLIERVVNRFEGKLLSKDIRITIDCPQDAKAITNDKIVDTVVFNYISNAIKYSGAASVVQIKVSQERAHTLIAVVDQGPGIPAEFHERIFEKFYRVKNDQVYRVRGTGLGLYLCRYFAQRVNAQVYCHSEPGQGSTFYLKL